MKGGKSPHRFGPPREFEMLHAGLIRRAGPLALAGILVFLLGGCTYVLKETFTRGLQDRTGDEQLEDARIDVVFTEKINKINADLIYDVFIDVWKGRVMLTGVVDDPGLIPALSRLAGEDVHARAVYNEIQVVPRREKGVLENTLSPFQKLKDMFIELDVKTKLFSDENVKSVNYHLRSVLNRVYVIGRSGSAGERRLVIRHIRETQGVKSVKEFIETAPPARANQAAGLTRN